MVYFSCPIVNNRGIVFIDKYIFIITTQAIFEFKLIIKDANLCILSTKDRIHYFASEPRTSVFCFFMAKRVALLSKITNFVV